MVEKIDVRVCPQCGARPRKPVKRCPECKAPMEVDREQNLADKASADSFPASDPPSY